MKKILSIVLVGFLFLSCSKKDSKENVLNVVIQANIAGLDPNHGDYYTDIILSLFYQRMFQYNYLKRPYELEPYIADGWPTVSEDKLTHTFKIKKGIMYIDDQCFPGGKGREFSAADFEYGIKRTSDPKGKGQNFWIFDGKIKGLNEWRKKRESGKADYDTAVSGLKVLDAHTLQITLTKPYYQLYYVMAGLGATPLPRECVEHYGKEFLNHAVGTGPYRLDRWVPNSKMVFVKNEKYMDEFYPSEGMPEDQTNGMLADAGKKIPFADKIVLHEMVEDQPRWLNFLKGNLDVTAIPKDSYDNNVKDGKPVGKFKEIGGLIKREFLVDTVYNIINMKDPILGKHKKLRQAMSLARDREWMKANFYNNRAVVAQSMIPPGVDGYDPKYRNPYSKKDIDKAKRLLKEAGFPGGKGLPEFSFQTTGSATSRQFAEKFKNDMAEIGIKIKVFTSTWPEYIKKMKENKTQLSAMGWNGDYPDAQNFLQLLYGPHKIPGDNNSNYDNPAYNKIYDKAMATPPGPERTKLYQQLRDIYIEDVPYIHIVHRISEGVYHPWLKNYKPGKMIGNRFKYYKVDVDQRNKGKKKL